MNLKKTVISLFAAGSILMGGLGGATAQSNSTQGVVNVTAGGTFNAYFCTGNENASTVDLDFGDATVNSSSGNVELNGFLNVCYEDTKNSRGAFDSHLSASDFTTWQHSGTIDNSNLSLGFVTHVNSGQWDASDGVGTISGRKQSSTGSRSVARPGAEYGANNFDTPGGLLIAQGISGIGTGSDHYQSVVNNDTGAPYQPDARSTQGSWHVLEVKLEVPQTTQAGEYKNDFTITINPPTT